MEDSLPSLLETMRSNLSCSICFQLFSKPKTLPCMHTFCEECLMKHIEAKTKEVNCPMCDQQITMKMVRETKTNFNYVSMIEELRKQDRSSFCSQCKEGVDGSEAVGYCNACDLYLCSYCVEGHRRNRTQSEHEIKPLQQKEQKSLVLPTQKKCQLHDEKLNMYCVTCDEVICQYCIITQGHNKDCSVNFIDKKTVESECKVLLQKVGSLKEAYKQLKEEESVLGNEKDQVKSTYERLTRQIDERKVAIRQEVDTEVAQVKKELQEWYNHAMKSCTLRYETVESRMNNVSTVIADCESLSATQPTIDALVTKISLSKKIEHFVKTTGTMQPSAEDTDSRSDPVEFIERGLVGFIAHGQSKTIDLQVLTTCPTEGEEVEVAVKIGDQKTAHNSLCTARIDGETVAAVSIDSGYHVRWTPRSYRDQQVDVEIPEYRMKGSIKVSLRRNYSPLTPIPTELSMTTPPLGVCFISNNEMAVTTNGKKIKVVNTDSFTEMREIDDNFVRPYFMSLDERKENLWVTDREAHNVKRVSLIDYKVDLQYGSRGAGYSQLSHPRGIAVSQDNQRVYVSDMKNNRIVVLKIGNDNAITELTTFGQDMLNQPAGVAFNDKGELAVCDDRNCRLVLFSSNGKFLRTMGVGKQNTGLLCSPIGIAIDDYGRYIVGEFGSHCVTTLSAEGDILSCTRSAGGVVKEFTYPRGVAVDNNGLIYVADHGNKRIVKM